MWPMWLQSNDKESTENFGNFENSKKGISGKQTSKRIKCETCVRKFNKRETYDRHLEKCQNLFEIQNQPSQDIFTRSMRYKRNVECTGP